MVVILLLLCSVFLNIAKFFECLFVLKYNAPETSMVAGVTIRIFTFLVSYGLVELVFNALGWFNTKLMSISYFIISTLLEFVLAFLVWVFE